MNGFQLFIQLNELDEVKVMNEVQQAGECSDNCITAADVADEDADNCAQMIENIGFIYFK